MNKIIPIESCGIILSYKCQCGCKHCLYACGPEWEGWMERSQLEKLLMSIKKLWTRYPPRFNPNVLFNGVHLAGGEPFLNFSFLLDAVKMMSRIGVDLGYIETNAGWCIDKDDVHDKFKKLYDAELRRIFISCSPFHAEKIPLKRTMCAIESAISVFGKDKVIVFMAHCIEEIAKFSIDEPVPIERWIERYGRDIAGKIFWQGYQIIPGGRSGYRLGDLTKKLPAEYFKGQNCSFELLYSRHAHFDLYSNYIPYFCGGISLGKVDSGLQNFYIDFDPKRLPLVDILIRDGPYGMMRFAQENFGYKEITDGYAGKCHLCVDVRRYLVSKTDEFKELYPRKFYKSL